MSTLAPPAPAGERAAPSTRFRGSWRTSLRIARREIRRAKARSALIAAMIGIPIMLIAGVVVFQQTTTLGSDGQALRELGTAADARIIADNRGPVVQDPYGMSAPVEASSEPSDPKPWTVEEVTAATGAEVTPYYTGNSVIRLRNGGAIAAAVRELDLRRPVAGGLGTITSGRAPTADDEVAVSQAVLDRGYAIGDTLEVGRTEEPRSLRITGVVRNPADLNGAQLVALAGSVLTADEARLTYLIDAGGEIDWERVQELNRLGLVVISRAVVTDPPPPESIPAQVRMSSSDDGLFGFYVLVVAIIFLEVVLLAGPAFAVGARRQSRELALLVTTGATPRDVRRIVLAQALVLGVGSAVLGAVLGVLAIALGRPLIEPFVGSELGAVRVPVLVLFALVAVGAVAALAAAFVPARQAGRRDTVTALAGRRGEVHPRRGWPVVGLVLVIAGILLTFVVTVGSFAEMSVAIGTIVLVLGAIVLTPSLLALVGRIGGRLPLAGRLATRDAARHRSRTTPAVAAIMGAVTGVTALAIGSASDFAENRRDYAPRAAMDTMVIALPGQPGFAEVTTTISDRLRADLPGVTPHVLSAVPSQWDGPPVRTAELLRPRCTDANPRACVFRVPVEETTAGGSVSYGGEFYGVLVAEPDAVAARIGRELSPEQIEALETGGALVPHEAALVDGRATVVTYADRQRGGAQDPAKLRLPGAVLSQRHEGAAYDYLADLVITPETAERLRLDVTPTQLVVPPGDAAVDREQQEQLNEFVRTLVPDVEDPVYVERGFDESYTPILLALAAAGGLIVLVGTSTATALALTDARPDFATLGAVGASTALRRRVAMGQAAVIGGLGALFGVVVGFGPGVAVAYPLTNQSAAGPIVAIPWTLLALVVIGVPLIAVIGAGLFTRSRLPLVRRID